jgi:hypothetical protein
VLTDQEKALKNPFSAELPATRQLLYVWHINKRILGKTQKIWKAKVNDDDEAAQEKDE